MATYRMVGRLNTAAPESGSSCQGDNGGDWLNFGLRRFVYTKQKNITYIWYNKKEVPVIKGCFCICFKTAQLPESSVNIDSEDVQ